MKRAIHCCKCNKRVPARLTTGQEVYPHSHSLRGLPFWICDTCGNFVGCHHKTKHRTKPLGDIATPEIRQIRSRIHKMIDPMWKNGQISRNMLYARLSEVIGEEYHTGNIRNQEDADKICEALREMQDEL